MGVQDYDDLGFQAPDYYDPDEPTPSPFTGGHIEDGAVDTRKAAERDDVLVYTSAPLDAPLDMRLAKPPLHHEPIGRRAAVQRAGRLCAASALPDERHRLGRLVRCSGHANGDGAGNARFRRARLAQLEIRRIGSGDVSRIRGGRARGSRRRLGKPSPRRR